MKPAARLTTAWGHAFAVGDVLRFDTTMAGAPPCDYVVTGVVSCTEITVRPNRWYWRAWAAVVRGWRWLVRLARHASNPE